MYKKDREDRMSSRFGFVSFCLSSTVTETQDETSHKS